MKVCKKCKKKVANKDKICKYCGSDVSKCKIITNSNTSKKQNNKVVKEVKKEEIENKNLKDVNIKETNINNNQNNKEDKKTSKKKINLFSKIKKIKKDYDKKEKALEKKAITKKDVKKFKTRKLVRLGIFIFIILVIAFFIIFGIRKLFNISGVNVVKEGSYNNVFSMNEKIKYKDVIYSVTDVYASDGTEYRSPKDGNEYVVVTINFENDSNGKTRYSYQDWKMVNSLGEEKSRTFTPINVSTALYTGNLVKGGKKSGSLVFEEPIGDEELYLNFYEYKENEEVDEESEPVFKIKIELPLEDE